MSDTTTKGRRWTDSTKVIWGLFGTVGLLFGLLCSMAWAQITDNTQKIECMREFTAKAEANHEEILRRLDRIEKNQNGNE